MSVRLWIPGVVCLLGGVVGRIALGWDGITNGRLQYAQIAFWQLCWYSLGWLLIALHLHQASARAAEPGPSTRGRWGLWWAGVAACTVAVFSSCPP